MKQSGTWFVRVFFLHFRIVLVVVGNAFGFFVLPYTQINGDEEEKNIPAGFGTTKRTLKRARRIRGGVYSLASACCVRLNVLVSNKPADKIDTLRLCTCKGISTPILHTVRRVKLMSDLINVQHPPP